MRHVKNRVIATKVATPQTSRNLNIEDDDFTAWCEHPVTKFVASSYVQMAADVKSEIINYSLGLSDTTPSEQTLARIMRMRERLLAYQEFMENGKNFYDEYYEVYRNSDAG